MSTIIVATTNPGKLKEYAHLFLIVPEARVISPADLEIWVEVAETGSTLAENALLKARVIHAMLEMQAPYSPAGNRHSPSCARSCPTTL